MQKTGLLIVIFGILIVAGLGMSVIENQITLEGIAQGNGKVNSAQDSYNFSRFRQRGNTSWNFCSSGNGF